jgi:hypothetical protein
MMFRIKVTQRSCWKCLSCEQSGRLPGLISKYHGNVLLSGARSKDMEISARICGAMEACCTDAIALEVVP